MLEELVKGELNKFSPDNIYFKETTNPTNQYFQKLPLNFQLKPIKEKLLDILKTPKEEKGKFRTFVGETQIFYFEYNILEIPQRENYTTHIITNHINPSFFYLNSLEVKFKKIKLNESSIKKNKLKTKELEDYFSFIYNKEIKLKHNPEDVRIQYTQDLRRLNKTNLARKIPDSEKHFKVFSELGFDDVYSYKDLILTYPQFHKLFSEYPKENLILIKDSIYSTIIQYLLQNSTFPDQKISNKFNEFCNSYLNVGINEDTSFFYEHESESIFPDLVAKEWAKIELDLHTFKEKEIPFEMVKRGYSHSPLGWIKNNAIKNKNKLRDERTRRKNLEKLQKKISKK